MSYFTFILKKISKKRLTLIPIILVSVFLALLYRGNLIVMSMFSSQLQSDKQLVEVLKKDVVEFKEKLKKLEPTSTAYLDTKYNIEMAEQRAKLLQLKLAAYEKENWKVYYENDRKLTDITLKTVQEDESMYSKGFASALKIDKKYAQYREKHNLAYEERLAPTQGISYMIRVWNDYIPMILVFLLIFIISTMYCDSYVDGMNIHGVVALSRMKKQSAKLLAGVTCGIFTFLFLSIIPIICGMSGTTIGNLQSPILTYTLESDHTFISLQSVLPQVLLLSMLSIFFVVNFISIISLFVKRNLPCLIVSLAVLLGLMWMTTSIAPFSSITHLFPTTYVSSLKVVSGELMNTVHNANISFRNGVIVLCSSNVILYGLYYVGSKISFKKVR